MAASAPALPPPKDWPVGLPHTVVTNTVFEELVRQGATLRESCTWAPIEALHAIDECRWIPANEKLWCIPTSQRDLEMMTGYTLAFAGMFLSLKPYLAIYTGPAGYTNEARFVMAMLKADDDKGTTEILGYNNGKDNKMWVDLDGKDYDGKADLGGFPIILKATDQEGLTWRTL